MLTHLAFNKARDQFINLPEDELELTEAGFIMTKTHLGPNMSPTLLEDWQILLVNNGARYQWYGKSRQTGYSFGSSLKKLARSYLQYRIYRKRYLGMFLSINQEEAQNKIYYVLQAHETLPPELKNGPLKLVAESKQYVEFACGARIKSHPAKAIRGFAGADITLDEAAHIQRVESVYRGTTAASIRLSAGEGGITVGSTPLGEVGLFYEMSRNNRDYSSFKGQRYRIHWWDSTALCVNVTKARERARLERWDLNVNRMDVERRVMKYGSNNLRAEFYALPLEDFLQEYEIGFNAVSNALISSDELYDATVPEYNQITLKPSANPSMAVVDEIMNALIPAFRLAQRLGISIWAGYDYARKIDQSVLVLVAPVNGNAQVLARVILRSTRYDIQKALLYRVMMSRLIYKMNIDTTGGYGAETAEALTMEFGLSEDEKTGVQGVSFTNTEKHYMATKTKSIYSQRKIVHGGDRELIRQTASVRRELTAQGLSKYEGGGPDNHADVFWALALALRDMPLAALVLEIDTAKSHVTKETQVHQQARTRTNDEAEEEEENWVGSTKSASGAKSRDRFRNEFRNHLKNRGF